ncbi:thiopeptide maturation pyridine synthase [Nonomuraea jiangxiensis]|uniref:Lantibiotic biosynthesis dehydratase C-term n=1 Tax=Nonomuraea jiangxiensis TaxID=633440 RepID=A0A1G8RZV1_9ACTN|nr:thiopeptide maturation pyridine synthase [Nonomuraea jiangxiensis]SDJ22544.1 Lantibiotic biosynthesis dehydratase C-term [Nonomuraea jiangxiensis]
MDKPTEWHSVHVHYYEPDFYPLVLDAVQPLFAHLAAPAYFVRHWRRGDHLRLQIRADQDWFDEVARPVIDGTVGAYLEEHPSRARIDERLLLAAHRELAHTEQDSGPLWPFRPDNSIHYQPYDDRAEVLGSRAAAELFADFHVAVMPSTFETIAAVRTGVSRMVLALDLLLAVAHARCADPEGGGIRRGFISLRSHADAMIASTREPEATRALLDAQYSRHRAYLTRRLGQVVAAADGTGPAIPLVRDWLAATEPISNRCAQLIRSGEITPTEHEREDEKWDWAGLRHSRLHQLIYANDAYRDFLWAEPWFHLYRLMLNQLYLHLHRLGFSAVERFQLCHLAACAVEEVYGLSALEHVERYVRAHPNSGARA